MLALDGGPGAIAGGGPLIGHSTPTGGDTPLVGLVASGSRLAERPVSELVAVLGRVGARFLDPADPLRREAEARIPDEAGLSAEMARVVVDGMARDWVAERLDRLVRSEFPDPTVLDGFRPSSGGELVRAWGGRLAFHVGSGSVPGIGATSLIRSLLVKCPLLLKPGRGDQVLPDLLRRGLADVDPGLAESVAVEYWPVGEGGDLEEAALRLADRVVVYGGLETVDLLRSRIPPTTDLVAYHHRMSIGAVAREELSSPDRARVSATAAARAVALFDQRGCVSPQVIWVEEGGFVTPVGWAAALAEALADLDAVLPPGPLDPFTTSEMQQLRGTAELLAAAGKGNRTFGGGPGAGWMVLYEPNAGPPVACGGRVVRVVPTAGLQYLSELLAPYRQVLQTFAVAAPPSRRLEIAEWTHRAGITRFTTFEEQPWPPAWWRHDGRGPLRALVRWIAMEPGLHRQPDRS